MDGLLCMAQLLPFILQSCHMTLLEKCLENLEVQRALVQRSFSLNDEAEAWSETLAHMIHHSLRESFADANQAFTDSSFCICSPQGHKLLQSWLKTAGSQVIVLIGAHHAHECLLVHEYM